MSDNSVEKEAAPSLVMAPVEPAAQEPEAVSEEKEVDLESMLGSTPQIPMVQPGPLIAISKKYLKARKRRLKVRWNGFGEKAETLPYPEFLDNEQAVPEDEDIKEMNKLLSLKYGKEKSRKTSSKSSEDRKPKTMKPNFVVHFACHGIRPIALSGRLRTASEDNNELRLTLRVSHLDAGRILGAFGNTSVSRKLYVQRTSILDANGKQHGSPPTPNRGRKRRSKGNYEVTSIIVDTTRDNVDSLRDTMQVTIRASRT